MFDAIEFRAGHGMGTQLATALTNINEALYVGSWFLSAFFLLAAGALALTSARRALGWSAIAIALLSLAGAAAPANSLAENTVLLWFIWIVWASISLARSERAPAGAAAVASRSTGGRSEPRLSRWRITPQAFGAYASRA